MKTGKDLDTELYYQCKERATMRFPRVEKDGSTSNDYDEHLEWIDGYYGR
jgi:hypothetical protein